MRINRKLVAIAAAVVALAAGGVGIAYAVGGGESEEPITGPSADKAEAAALDAAGGGTVLEAEHQEAGGSGVYEVEVQRPDGSVVEVLVDDQFQSVGTEADDDSGSESEDEGTEGEED
jgi:Peptidase propeptide and YPEB domain